MPDGELPDSVEPETKPTDAGNQARPAHHRHSLAGFGENTGSEANPESEASMRQTNPANAGDSDADPYDPQPPAPEIPRQPNPRFVLRRLFANWSQWTVIALSAIVLGARGSTTVWLAIHGAFAAVEIFGLAFFGTTPGRWIVGLRIESTSLNTISLRRSTLRHLIKHSPFVAIIALATLLPESAVAESVIAGTANLAFLLLNLFVFLPILTGTDGQGQHDLIAETMTVGARQSTSPAPLLDRYRQSSRHLFENSSISETEDWPPLEGEANANPSGLDVGKPGVGEPSDGEPSDGEPPSSEPGGSEPEARSDVDRAE